MKQLIWNIAGGLFIVSGFAYLGVGRISGVIDILFGILILWKAHEQA